LSEHVQRGVPAATTRLRLTDVRYAARDIHLLEFRRPRPDAEPLAPLTPGAHLDLHLRQGGEWGEGLVRQYSIVNSPDERDRYVVAVKRDPASRGGSAFVHDQLRVGAVIEIGGPRNNFDLAADDAPSVFIAGGIGITPIACMVASLERQRRPWRLHYSVRTREDAALLDMIEGEGLRLHVDDKSGGALLDIAAVVAEAPGGAHLYCCGPAPMLDAFEAAARGRPAAFVHVERFAPVAPSATGGGFTLRLAASKRDIAVRSGQTILQALREAGVEVQASCEQGICGTCETRVLGGRPDHRDSLLSDEEKARNDVMMVCCSGSLGDLLVLDL
jgi:vanillate O-demethylase ferredoxin subunit